MRKSKTATTRTSITGRDDLEMVMGEYAAAVIEASALKAELEKRTLEVREEYAARFAMLDEIAAGLLADMEAWAAGHPAEFAKRKSLELMHGVIGFRTGTPRVALPRKADEEELAATLEAAGLGDFVRRRIELDRQRILAAVADPAEDNKAEAVLATYGIRVRQSERFFAEVREEQVAGQQAVAAGSRQ